MKVTVLILTKDNEELITNCLNSVKDWAKEIVIVDSGSQDKTLKICQAFDCTIHEVGWRGFSGQRNMAARKTSGEWLLYLDPDERVTKKLRDEIALLPEENGVSAYAVNRENIILGKFLIKGGWYPDEQVRLVRRKELLGWEGVLHEYPKVRRGIGKLTGAIVHLTHRGINWSLEKTIGYTDQEAALYFKAGHGSVRWWHLFLAPIKEFWWRGLAKLGLFEGTEGVITVLYQAFDAFLVRAKIWELQKGKTWKQVYKEVDERLRREGKY